MRQHLDLNGIEERLIFQQAHLIAVSEWTHVELSLGRLVAHGAPAEYANAIFNAFFGIESFRAKLEFADRFDLAPGIRIP